MLRIGFALIITSDSLFYPTDTLMVNCDTGKPALHMEQNKLTAHFLRCIEWEDDTISIRAKRPVKIQKVQIGEELMVYCSKCRKWSHNSSLI